MHQQNSAHKLFLAGVSYLLLILSLGPLCAQTSVESALFSGQGIQQEDYAVLLSLVNGEEAVALQGYTYTYFSEPPGEGRNVWGYARPYRKELGFYVGADSPYTAQEIFFHELGHAMEVYRAQAPGAANDVFYCGETPNLPSQLSETYAEEYAEARLLELGLQPIRNPK